jgi:LAS superfamily LD-carboxypeptidase LdcB
MTDSRRPGTPDLEAALTGSTDDHLCTEAQGELLDARVHQDVLAPFLDLKAAAAQAGFELTIFSGFRGFERQLSIWNRKARGELAVLDSDAVPLDLGDLTPRELVFAILRWSALPGGSRHHWGTDLDVIDAAAIPPGYEIELIPQEVDPGGMFGPLHDWLDDRMEDGAAFGFFRPYDEDRGGVAPERWHLSHGPVAHRFEERLSPAILGEVLSTAKMELKTVVLDHLDEIYERFVVNTGRPRP